MVMFWESADTWIAITVMVVFWAALGSFVVLLLRRIPADDGVASSHAEELLAERLAKGEIDADEFRARRALLRG